MGHPSFAEMAVDLLNLEDALRATVQRHQKEDGTIR